MARDSGVDAELLNAALIGYQVQRERLAALIADIQGQLGRGAAASSNGPVTGRSSRANLEMPPAAMKPKRKRRLSAEGRAKIVAATKARWEAFRQAKAGKPLKKAR